MSPKESARHARAETALGRYPGVVGVGYGLKEVGDAVTDEIAFRVYVGEKKRPGELTPEETIPKQFEGVPTDVLRVRRVFPAGTTDTKRHSPLIGGITITNFREVAGEMKIGTLGCFATIDGATGDDRVVAIGNNHVIAAHGAAAGNDVFQPSILPSGAVDQNDRGPFGEIHNLGMKDHHNFQYAGDPITRNYYLDCATAKLNICVSSWCRTNCGVEYKNAQRELAVGNVPAVENKLSGVGRPQATTVVFMSGRETGASRGRILDTMSTVQIDAGPQLHGVIEIEPIDPPNGFSTEGDSGAAVIDEQRRIVGIVFGDNHLVGAAARTHACHIQAIMDYLNVTPITEANPPIPPAGKTRNDAWGVIAGGGNETMALRGRLLSTPRGREIWDVVAAHQGEVVGLVNHHRPVTVAWHRGQGPAFLAHAIENARDPAHRIPAQIEGVGRRALLERMAEALTAHGGRGLGAAIAAYRDVVLALAEDHDDLHELVGCFAATEGGVVHGRP